MHEAEDKVNANAPVKSVTMEMVATEHVVFVGQPNGVAAGPRLIAHGRCPGRGCGEPVHSRDPRLLRCVGRGDAWQRAERVTGQVGVQAVWATLRVLASADCAGAVMGVHNYTQWSFETDRVSPQNWATAATENTHGT